MSQQAPVVSTQLLLQAALQQGKVSILNNTEVQTGTDCEVLVLVGLPGQSCSFRCRGSHFATAGQAEQAPVPCRQRQKYMGNQICCKSSREALRCVECRRHHQTVEGVDLQYWLQDTLDLSRCTSWLCMHYVLDPLPVRFSEPYCCKACTMLQQRRFPSSSMLLVLVL